MKIQKLGYYNVQPIKQCPSRHLLGMPLPSHQPSVFKNLQTLSWIHTHTQLIIAYLIIQTAGEATYFEPINMFRKVVSF
jgi:hypothetical protein